MKKNEASRTAEYNALFRAMETKRPANKRLFEDQFARGFLGTLKMAYHLSRVPVIGTIVPWYIDWKWPGVRTSALGRTCLIDDQLRKAIHDGIKQIVILGAGYDSRAYRICSSEGLTIFEIDHPNTFKVKVDRLTNQIGPIPKHVILVPVDFDRQDFASVLCSSGFDRSQKTFFIWEGVMHYLTEGAVDATLRSIRSSSAKGSRLVFTYIHKGLLDGTASFGNLGGVPETLRNAGEQWKFGLYPDEIKSYIHDRGFSLVLDLGSVEYRSRYLENTKRNVTGFEFYRLSLAEVK